MSVNRRTLLQSVLAIPALLAGKVFGCCVEPKSLGSENSWSAIMVRHKSEWDIMRQREARYRDILRAVAFQRESPDPIPAPPLPAVFVRKIDFYRKELAEIASLRAGSPPVPENMRLTDEERAELAIGWPDDWEEDE